MARMSLQRFLVLAFWLSTTAWAGSVEFFYNVEQDTCNWGTISLSSRNNTANGGLCAYVAATKRVFACPAPDHVCWTLAQTCVGDSGDSPGPNQIQCHRNNQTWCCQNGETCSTTKDQINVCWGQFGNPNSDVQVAAAVSAEYSAIPSSQIATTSVTALPSVITTSAFGANTGPPSTSSSTTSSGTASSTSAATGTGSSDNQNPSSSKGVSGGAIAGIVIGVLVGLALIAGAVVFVLRRRRARQGSDAADHHVPMSQQGVAVEGQPFMASHELYGSQPQPSRQNYSDTRYEVDGGPSSSVSQLPSDEATGRSGTVTSGSVYSQPTNMGSSPSALSPSSAGRPVRYELQ